MKLTPEIRERILKVDPAAIGHYVSRGFMHPRIKAVAPCKILGTAYTVRATERDNTAIYYAIMKAEPGQIIVVDRGGEELYACCGDQLALLAKHRGLGGIIIDGPATDRLGLEKLDFPVFCTGFSPVTTTVRGTSGEVNIPIQCGGAVVESGSIIFGDYDGAMVIPDDYEDVLVLAEKMVAAEAERKRRVEEEGYRYTAREYFVFRAIIYSSTRKCRQYGWQQSAGGRACVLTKSSVVYF